MFDFVFKFGGVYGNIEGMLPILNTKSSDRLPFIEVSLSFHRLLVGSAVTNVLYGRITVPHYYFICSYYITTNFIIFHLIAIPASVLKSKSRPVLLLWGVQYLQTYIRKALFNKLLT